MAKQDSWVRLQVRMPPELHERLKDAAGASSLNADIVRRLEESLLEDRAREYHFPSVGRIVLDSEGRTLTREEVQRQLAAVIAASTFPIKQFQIEVLTPEVLEDKAEVRRIFASELAAHIHADDKSD